MKLVFHGLYMSPTLVVLPVGVPPIPSSLHVCVWRRLRSLGAVPLERSAYLLPDTPERYEDFQWLAQEIQREGGDATLIRVQQIENVTQEDVRPLFHEPSDLDYRQLATRYRNVLKELEQKLPLKSARAQEELARLAKDHQRSRDVDVFGAPGGAEVWRLVVSTARRGGGANSSPAWRSRRTRTPRRLAVGRCLDGQTTCGVPADHTPTRTAATAARAAPRVLADRGWAAGPCTRRRLRTAKPRRPE